MSIYKDLQAKYNFVFFLKIELWGDTRLSSIKSKKIYIIILKFLQNGHNMQTHVPFEFGNEIHKTCKIYFFYQTDARV